MLCLRSIVSALLALGSPASTPADGVTPEPAELPVDGAAPPRTGTAAQPGSGAWLPARGFAPATRRSSPPARSSDAMSAPPRACAGAAPAWGAASQPTGGVAPPGSADARSDPAGPPTGVAAGEHASSPIEARDPSRRIEVIRLEVVVGLVWRIRTTELMSLASVEFGRLRGFSGTVQGGIIVAPDRAFVVVADFPIGAGFVFRHRLGKRSLYGSVGLTAGVLVHRAVTDLGLVHRVDPDLQVPLRFAWTIGQIGLSVALLQGFSTRTRTYVRRGTEVWRRIPYRIGLAVGVHFDIGVGRTRSRRSNREPKGLP